MEKSPQNKTRIPRRGPGQPSKLTKTLALRIRTLYLNGKKIKEIQEELDIKPKTWDSWYWKDTQGFRSNFILWRREKMLSRSEQNLEEFTEMPTEIQMIEDSDDEDGARAVVVTDPKLLKIKLDATTYVTDTIGKDVYSKRIIQEDPDAAKKTDVDEVRQTLKNIMSAIRKKNHQSVSAKDKMAAAIKK